MNLSEFAKSIKAPDVFVPVVEHRMTPGQWMPMAGSADSNYAAARARVIEALQSGIFTHGWVVSRNTVGPVTI